MNRIINPQQIKLSTVKIIYKNEQGTGFFINSNMKRPIETYTDSFGQTIHFTVPEPHKQICINISGGADSAILLWMLIQ